jgi:hypothetical protein
MDTLLCSILSLFSLPTQIFLRGDFFHKRNEERGLRLVVEGVSG